MKQTKTILAVILLVVLAGCGENKQSNNDLIIVDVSKSYPKKELILQDFLFTGGVCRSLFFLPASAYHLNTEFI